MKVEDLERNYIESSKPSKEDLIIKLIDRIESKPTPETIINVDLKRMEKRLGEISSNINIPETDMKPVVESIKYLVSDFQSQVKKILSDISRRPVDIKIDKPKQYDITFERDRGNTITGATVMTRE